MCTESNTVLVPSYCMCATSLQLRLTLGDAVDHIPPGFTLHGILQARILECVAMPSSKRSSQPRYQTYMLYVSCTGRPILYF